MTQIIDTEFKVTPLSDGFLIETADKDASIILAKEALERLISSDVYVDPVVKSLSLAPIVYHDKSIYVFKRASICKGSQKQLREAYEALNRTQYEVGQLWKDATGKVRIVQKVDSLVYTAIAISPRNDALVGVTTNWRGDPAQELGWTLVS